jgi:hypothetical protein
LQDGRHFDFGLKNGKTYIDEGDKKKRENYWKRHMGNTIEKHLITRMIPSPALFSAYILWGASTNIGDNIIFFNKM